MSGLPKTRVHVTECGRGLQQESKREGKVSAVGQNPVSWNLIVLSGISFNLPSGRLA